jgi:hypothetical protein
VGELATVAALFVRYGGVYYGMPDVQPWGWPNRDAREYPGPHPVVAHPPCERWSQMNSVNAKRWGFALGQDGGCFQSALASVVNWGGVLEHPAETRAFPAFGLPRPSAGSWQDAPDGYVTEVRQSCYGHRARKRTWLFCSRVVPPEVDWRPIRGTHQIGGFDVTLPQLPRRERARTPLPFRDLLLSIARSVQR